MGLYRCWFCFLPAYFVFHLYSFFLPVTPSPSTVSSFFPLYLLYVPDGPAPRSSRSTALPSTTEAASCGLQDGAAHRQMSWQGRIRGLEEVHCRCHQPGIQLPNSIKLLLRVSKLKSLRGYHLASSCFPGDSKRGLLDTGDASFSKAWKKHDFWMKAL